MAADGLVGKLSGHMRAVKERKLRSLLRKYIPDLYTMMMLNLVDTRASLFSFLTLDLAP